MLNAKRYVALMEPKIKEGDYQWLPIVFLSCPVVARWLLTGLSACMTAIRTYLNKIVR